MQSSKFYPTRTVSCVVLLLLLMNAFSAWAQKISPASGTCMAYDSTATFTFNAAYGEVPTWSTQGDIKIVSTSGNTVTIASASAVVAGVTVYEYGKGRLLVTYGSSTCAPQQEYVDVFKTFTKTSDEIVGPDCVLPNELVTYSIRPYLTKNLNAGIGIDKYKWVVPAGWTVEYYSPDTSFVTLRTPATSSSSHEIQVYAGKCNTPASLGGTNAGAGWMYSKTIYQKPVKPALVSLPWCVPTNATNSTTITLDVLNPEPGVVYTWILPANWRFGANTHANSVSNVNIVIDNTAGTIRLAAKRSGETCEAVESTFKITRSVSSTSSTLAGPACVAGSAANLYTLTNAPNDTPFKWTFAPNANNVGWSFDAKQTGHSVMLTAGSTGGTLSVTSNECPGGPVFTLAINSIPPAASAMNGSACLTANSTGNAYSIAAIPGATSYTWTLTGGLTFPGGTRTLTTTNTSVAVNAGISGGVISVLGTNGTCKDDKNRMERFIGVAPATPRVTTTNLCYNPGAAMDRTFTIATPVAGQTYAWRMVDATTNAVTTNWTIKSATASSVTFTTAGTTGTYRAQAQATVAGCGTSAWGSSGILGAQPRVQVLVHSSPVGGDQLEAWNVTDNTATFPGGTTFQWQKNGVNLLNQTNRLLLLEHSGDQLTDTYCVVVSNGTCSQSTGCAQSIFDLGAARVSTEPTASPETELSRRVSVYPNPSSGEFTLTLPAFKGQAQVALKTLQGRTVFHKEVGRQQTKLAPGKLNTGVYLLQVTLDGKTVTKKVQIQK